MNVLIVDDCIHQFLSGLTMKKRGLREGVPLEAKTKGDFIFAAPDSSIMDTVINSDSSIDVILMDGDLGMYVPSGPDLVQRLREQGYDIPIYMISGSQNHQEEGVRRGANGYLSIGEIIYDWSVLAKLIQEGD